MEWMLLPLKRYAQFNGRSRRKEYWMWILFVVVASIILSILDSVLGLGGRTNVGPGAVPGGYNYGAAVTGGVLANLFILATFIPGLAVSVRRLHDIDRSGWWILLPLLPYVLGFAIMFGSMAGGMPALAIVGGLAFLVGLICGIVLLVWYCSAGTNGPNRFGPDPKGVSTEQLAETFE